MIHRYIVGNKILSDQCYALLILLCYFNLLIGVLPSKQIFIDYSHNAESVFLKRYFYQIQGELYVHIGSYDPVNGSKTLQFNHWQGINVEASANRNKNFIKARPHQINIHAAITNYSQQNSILYELDPSKDYHSTTSMAQKQKFIITKDQQIKTKEETPSLTLAQLCQRYYSKTPKLIIISVGGTEVQILQSNNWNNTLCVPQMFMIETRGDLTKKLQIQKLMEKHLFIKRQEINQSTIYLHVNNEHDYTVKYQKSQNKFNKIVIVKWEAIIPYLVNKFKTVSLRNDYYQHVKLDQLPIFLYFIESKEIANIPQIQQYSNFITNQQKLKNRPILILHFNPLNNFLFLGENVKNYTLQKHSDEKFYIPLSFWQITITSQENIKSTIIILDHLIKLEESDQQQTKLLLLDDNSKVKSDYQSLYKDKLKDQNQQIKRKEQLIKKIQTTDLNQQLNQQQKQKNKESNQSNNQKGPEKQKFAIYLTTGEIIFIILLLIFIFLTLAFCFLIKFIDFKKKLSKQDISEYYNNNVSNNQIQEQEDQTNAFQKSPKDKDHTQKLKTIFQRSNSMEDDNDH